MGRKILLILPKIKYFGNIPECSLQNC